MSISVWKKLTAGSVNNKTRLHDQRGTPVPIGRLIRNGPRALATGVLRIAADKRPPLPWISYDAQAHFEKALNAQSRVLEFGSGMSTIWYAAHSAHVVSIDDFRPWYDKVSKEIADRALTNITYRFAPTREEYSKPTLEEQGSGFDLIMIDGSYRDDCAHTAIALIKPGGMIYLDNADRSHVDPRDGDAANARNILLDYAAKVGASVTWFTDFAPTQFYVGAGLLITAP